MSSISTEMTAPDISPNVRTVFFIGPLPNVSGVWRWHLAPALRFRVTRTDDFAAERGKIIRSGDQSLFLRPLHGLRPPPRRELVEQPRGVGLHRVLAHEEPFADFPGAQPRRDRLENLQFARGDPQLRDARFVRWKGPPDLHHQYRDFPDPGSRDFAHR